MKELEIRCMVKQTGDQKRKRLNVWTWITITGQGIPWRVRRSNISGGSCWGDIDGVCLLSYWRRVIDGEIATIRL